MKPQSKYCWILLLVVASCPASAATKIAKTGDTVVEGKALTIQGGFGQCINGMSFQQDALASHGNHQYVAFYDADRRLCLTRRKLPAGDWAVVRFPDYPFRSNDAHNTISLGICPKDGTIHLAFDHHGHPLHYRVSRKGVANSPEGVTWEASLFGPVTSELEKGKSIRITYPRFWQTPDGGLQFCYRQGGSGNGDRMLVDYDAETGVWIDTRQIDSRQGLFEDDNAYLICSDAWTRKMFSTRGDLMILAATSKANWKDWKTLHVEKGPFINEMLGDYYRWKQSKMLSVMVQESPKEAHEATPLRILDFVIEEE